MSENLEEFEKFVRSLRIEGGQGMELLDFEEMLVEPYFAGVTESVVIVPKKNGKTSLMAALALFHLLDEPEAECVIGASSRDQAGILFRQAAKIVERSGLEELQVRTGYREIRGNGGRIRVLAADADTSDGVIPTLALVDELHRHRSADLYGVFSDGLVARDGRMITISTAGWDMESQLGKLRKRAHELGSFRRVGAHNSASAPGFAFHEWCLEDGDDLADMKLVKEANPAPWKTVEYLAQKHSHPSMRPAQWARFHCGVWTHGEEPWLAADVWDRLGVDIGGIREGDTVAAAVVYGHGAAVVLAKANEDGSVAVKAHLWPEDVPLAAVEDYLSVLSGRYTLGVVAFESALSRSAEILAAQGLPMVEFPLSPLRLSVATSGLRKAIDEGKLRHDGDGLLRQHVLAGATTDSERGWRLIRSPETQGLIALAMAVHEATAVVPAPPMVEAL